MSYAPRKRIAALQTNVHIFPETYPRDQKGLVSGMYIDALMSISPTPRREWRFDRPGKVKPYG
ncbi:hypothetical protein GCM10023184_03930 [Flaviaesturariibacter amylovorans]|uniref:Uncharacterized protein n=1 Tax=Flaviaesturariibacter amylovorans TaxID=1084520 RepID=A0ABP8G856_9BACT